MEETASRVMATFLAAGLAFFFGATFLGELAGIADFATKGGGVVLVTVGIKINYYRFGKSHPGKQNSE